MPILIVYQYSRPCSRNGTLKNRIVNFILHLMNLSNSEFKLCTDYSFNKDFENEKKIDVATFVGNSTNLKLLAWLVGACYMWPQTKYAGCPS